MMPLSTCRTIIVSCGGYLPRRVLSNAELESMVDTSDEWIVQRTGIRERRIAAEDEKTSDMAIKAGQAALDRAGLTGADVDGVIVATATPDLTFPSVAVRVQSALGIGHGAAFDVQAACSGFIYAMSVADSLIRCGQARRLMIVGAEKFSSIIDWNDRRTCVLFGDGAGAMILEAGAGEGTFADQGILSTHLHADGSLQDILRTTGGTATTGHAGTILMEGREVFRHAVGLMADIVGEVLAVHRLTGSDIDWLVPHQANMRIIEATARKLDLPMERVLATVVYHGNTSAASIPLALADALEKGKIKRGEILLFEALGGGLTWGAALARF